MKMFVKALLVLCFVHFARGGVWFHAGHACIKAKDDGYQELTYDGPSSFVGAAKLVHTSGYVSNAAKNTGSFWGANDGKPLGTLITDDDNRILYPSPRVTSVNSKGWYELPGYKGKSPKLVFTDFGASYDFEKGRKIRVWYGEDWIGFTEADNHGKSCMDVYFYLMGR